MMLKCASLYDHMIPSEYEYASVRAKCPCLASYILYLPKWQRLQNSEPIVPGSHTHGGTGAHPPTKVLSSFPEVSGAEVILCF